MIALLTRHAARSPKENVFDQNFGETEVVKDIFGNGGRMNFLLGQHLRKNVYPKLFEENDIKKYKIYSSDTERAVVSTLSFMMGAVPLKSGPKISPF